MLPWLISSIPVGSAISRGAHRITQAVNEIGSSSVVAVPAKNPAPLLIKIRIVHGAMRSKSRPW